MIKASLNAFFEALREALLSAFFQAFFMPSQELFGAALLGALLALP
jgi:hypothetical protein